MKRWSSGAILGVVLGLVGFVAPPALAIEPPANDTYDGRTVIDLSVLHQTFDFNLSDYTGDADDETVKAFAQATQPTCADVAGPASAWFGATPSRDGTLRLMGQAEYGAAMVVVSGTLDDLQALEYCGSVNFAQFDVQAGTPYVILVMEYVGDPWLVNLHVDYFPVASIELRLDQVSGLDPTTGIAKVWGTYVCEYADGSGASLGVWLSQEKGKAKTSPYGEGYYFITDFPVICDGAVRPWWVTVSPDNGLFKSGSAFVRAGFRVENSLGLSYIDEAEAEVTLRAAKALR